MTGKQAKKQIGRAASGSVKETTLVEFSSRLGIQKRRLRVAVAAAESLGEPEFKVVEALVSLVLTTPRNLKVRRELSAGLRQELKRFWTSDAASDPLADVDEALDTGEAIASSLWAATRARLNRARLLEDCISANEAGELTDRSRQAVERQRRMGSLLALRVGREWRYPKWQFDVDGPGGLVPGLEAVLRNLHLSPFGAALWLTTPKTQLDGKKPAELLRQRQGERVVRLAEEHGHML